MGRPDIRVGVARRWFWSLVVVAVLAMSALYRSLSAEPGAAAGLVVLVSGLLLAVTTTQAARIWFALDRPAPRARRLVGSRLRRRPSRSR